MHYRTLRNQAHAKDNEATTQLSRAMSSAKIGLLVNQAARELSGTKKLAAQEYK
jgi:hypothetical protein